MSTSEGEIHGIGFDEDNTLNNNTRIFEIFGTQNWSNAIQVADKYTTSDLGTFRDVPDQRGTSSTPGTASMFLVLVNDKDSGAVARIRARSGTCASSRTFHRLRRLHRLAARCLHVTDFETGANGWTHDAEQQHVLDRRLGSRQPGWRRQRRCDDAARERPYRRTGVNAFFTEPNRGGAGTNDVDNGVCCRDVTHHRCEHRCQRPGDALVLPRSTGRGGRRVQVTSSAIDVSNERRRDATRPTSCRSETSRRTPRGPRVTTTIANPGQLKIRVRASDGAGPGDLVEARHRRRPRVPGAVRRITAFKGGGCLRL